jgi:hypothetical protein
VKAYRIGFIGSRGIPRCYSGFETFVEQVSVRLAAKGHHVTVYNRIPFNTYRQPEFRGVKIIRLPTIPGKSTDTLVHSFLCVIHAIFKRYDILYICGVGSALLAAPARMFGIKTVVNVDGADYERAKWSGFGRWWLKKSEMWAAKLANVVVADHPTIQRRYRDLYGRETELIAYGADVVVQDPGDDILKTHSLEKRKSPWI